MIETLGLTTNFKKSVPQKQKITYTLNADKPIKGPLRSIQKFIVILLTTLGSDPIRPWLGTYMNDITTRNIVNTVELRTFIKEQCNRAISQFFQLQGEESSQNIQGKDDVITYINLNDITINSGNSVSVVFEFIPLDDSAIVFSIDFDE